MGQLRFIRTVRTVWSWPEGLLMNPTLHFCLQAVQDQQVTMAFYLWRFNMPSWSAFFPALAWRMALPSGSIVPGSKRGSSYVSLVAPTIGDVAHVFKPKWWFVKKKKRNMSRISHGGVLWQKKKKNSKYCSIYFMQPYLFKIPNWRIGSWMWNLIEFVILHRKLNLKDRKCSLLNC